MPASIPSNPLRTSGELHLGERWRSMLTTIVVPLSIWRHLSRSAAVVVGAIIMVTSSPGTAARGDDVASPSARPAEVAEAWARIRSASARNPESHKDDPEEYWAEICEIAQQAFDKMAREPSALSQLNCRVIRLEFRCICRGESSVIQNLPTRLFRRDKALGCATNLQGTSVALVPMGPRPTCAGS
jgi:hypothetical protein